MGQNFLVDANILGIITDAAALNRQDTVIEVGTGLGVLTEALAGLAGEVFSIEVDRGLAAIAARELSDAENLTLVNADAMRFDLSSFFQDGPPQGVKLVANLPYGIAATLLINYLDRYPWITEYIIMVQKEVGDRLTSDPGSRDYSAATVRAQVFANLSRIARVSRNSFYPKPMVDSVIIRISRKEQPLLPGPDATFSSCSEADEEASFFNRIVSAAFNQRRKKLVNALSSGIGTGIKTEAVRQELVRMGLPVDARAEMLSPADFVELSRRLRD